MVYIKLKITIKQILPFSQIQSYSFDHIFDVSETADYQVFSDYLSSVSIFCDMFNKI